MPGCFEHDDMSCDNNNAFVSPGGKDRVLQCTLTVMDTIADPDIRFDGEGICNYWHEYQAAAKALAGESARNEALEKLLDRIKRDGKGKQYDCVIGLSGGVDSTYVAWLTRQWGLRPLAVHLDNGWNSELAVMNIESIVRTLDIDLYTLVINWEEFRDIQLAYLKASVVDIEVVSDHAIFSTVYRLAAQYRIPHILSGTNIATEFIMPPSWIYSKMDFANLRHIHDTFGRLRRKTYPSYNFLKHLYYNACRRLTPVSILNYVTYNKQQAKKTISEQLNWRDYGGKHYESIFTKFYQAYILPQKFGIDKRKPHLSTLICSGQLSKAEAMKELEQPLYQPDELIKDKEYVLKKLGLSEHAFDEIMALTPRPHADFRSDLGWKKRYMDLLVKTAPIRSLLKRKRA